MAIAKEIRKGVEALDRHECFNEPDDYGGDYTSAVMNITPKGDWLDRDEVLDVIRRVEETGRS